MLPAAGIRSAYLLRPSLVTRTGALRPTRGPATSPMSLGARLRARWARWVSLLHARGGRP